jgi:hypothetical protein
VLDNVKNFKKASGIVEEKAGIPVDGNVKKVGKIKFDIRREADAGKRLALIDSCFKTIGGEAGAAKTEPQLLAELLVLRSKEFLKTQVDNAVRDALKAVELAAGWAQAQLALGSAFEAAGRAAEGVVALQEALNIGKCINKNNIKRQMTRLNRKAAEDAAKSPEEKAAEEAAKAAAAAAAAAAAPAPAETAAKPKPAAKKTATAKKPAAASKDARAAAATRKTSADAKKAEKNVTDKKTKDKPEQ